MEVAGPGTFGKNAMEDALLACEARAAASGVAILDWKPVRRNTLCGFGTVRIERIGLVVADVAVHQKNQSR
jgi:hypothetical protein